jgi:hypothetical protein
LDGINGTGEIGDDAVAGAAKDPPAIGCDALVENSATSAQPAQGANLVLTHQPAVACDIDGKDCRQLADGFFFLAHGADKANPFAMRGAEEALLFPAVADRAARGIDPRAQCRFRNDAPVPHGCQQILLSNDALAVADRVLEEVENLGL